MMSAKLATPGLLKIKVYWNKGNEVLISVCDVRKKISSFGKNNIVDLVIIPKFGSPSISVSIVVITWTVKGLTKKRFFEDDIDSQSIFGTGTWDELENNIVAKTRIPTFEKVTGECLVGAQLYFLNYLKLIYSHQKSFFCHSN